MRVCPNIVIVCKLLKDKAILKYRPVGFDSEAMRRGDSHLSLAELRLLALEDASGDSVVRVEVGRRELKLGRNSAGQV